MLVFLGLTFRRRFLDAAAVAVVAAAHWAPYRRALTWTREAVTSLQNVHQILRCRERDLISQCFNVKLCSFRFLQTSYWLSYHEPGIRICSPHRMFR